MMENIKKTRRRKVSLSENNRQWVDETGDFSRLVNQALIHYKFCLSSSIPSLQKRFNLGELEVILKTFKHFMNSVPVYFSDLDQFRDILHQIDKQKLNRTREWKTAYRILSEHTPLDEVNAIVFLTKFNTDALFSGQSHKTHTIISRGKEAVT